MSELNMHNGFWLGVDVAKATFDVAAAPVAASPADWAKLPTAHFESNGSGLTAFEQWLKPLFAEGKCVGVCLESTGIYSHRFVKFISMLELPECSMVNPALPVAFRKSFGLRDKCDRVDSAVLALYGVVHTPKPNVKRSPEYERLRALWRLHEDYIEDVRRWKNRCDQILDCLEPTQINLTVTHLQECAQKVWKEIEKWVQQHESLRHDAQLLCSIPSVGQKTAFMVMAEYGNLRAWSRKQVISYAGLYPKVYSSGTSVNRKPCLAKGGGQRIRRGLFLPACSATKYNPLLAQWRQVLLERGKARMATIGAMMRKMLVLMRGVLVSETAFDLTKLITA